MTSRARKILEEALTLPEKERLFLAEALQESVGAVESQADVDAAWQQEIERRLKSIEDGTAVLRDGETVFRELMSKYERWMALQYRILIEAERELTEASAWYDNEREDLGRELLLAYRAVVVHALEFPESGSPIRGLRTRYKVRQFVFERFPYSIILAYPKGELVVVAVAHQHRRPGYWRKRLAKVKP
jgi:putative addiction module component (TIGR02574 family)